LIVGCDNGDVRVLDTADGRILHRVAGHTTITQGVAVSADGNVLSGSWDGTVKLWTFEPKAAADPDRKAAEWVLSIGGIVKVNGEAREIKAPADLPQGVFDLTCVHLVDNPKVSDAGLTNFKDCKNLTRLVLFGTPVSDAGLAHLKDCKNFQDLILNGIKVGDAGLAYFKDCKNLKHLALGGTQMSGAGLAHLKDCNSLKTISLNGSKVS